MIDFNAALNQFRLSTLEILRQKEMQGIPIVKLIPGKFVCIAISKHLFSIVPDRVIIQYVIYLLPLKTSRLPQEGLG